MADESKTYKNVSQSYEKSYDTNAAVVKAVPVETENTTKKYEEKQETTQTVTQNQNIAQESVREPDPPPKDDRINVVRDYDWTYSRNKNRKLSEIPYVEVREFKMLGNSYVSSLMTSTLLFRDAAKYITDGGSALISTLQDGLLDNFKADNKFADFMNTAINSTGKVTDSIVSSVKPAVNWAENQIKSIDKTAERWGNDDLYQKYAYLYLRKPTGRIYTFPFFNNSYINISNNFSDSYESKSGLQEMTRRATDLFTKAAEWTAGTLGGASIKEPGMYIQRPQFYNFQDSPYSVDIEFYLFNTLPSDNDGVLPYVKNMELITKLVIQNTVHRHSRILVDPPCIYELTVPGRGFYPYAYIKSLNVEHVGTKRIINSNNKQLIVPDAFKVTISFQSLTTEVNNFMIPQMGDAGIDVSKRFGIGNPLVKAVGNALNDIIGVKKTEDSQKISDKKTEDAPKITKVNSGGATGSTGFTDNKGKTRQIFTSSGFMPYN